MRQLFSVGLGVLCTTLVCLRATSFQFGNSTPAVVYATQEVQRLFQETLLDLEQRKPIWTDSVISTYTSLSNEATSFADRLGAVAADIGRGIRFLDGCVSSAIMQACNAAHAAVKETFRAAKDILFPSNVSKLYLLHTPVVMSAHYFNKDVTELVRQNTKHGTFSLPTSALGCNHLFGNPHWGERKPLVVVWVSPSGVVKSGVWMQDVVDATRTVQLWSEKDGQ